MHFSSNARFVLEEALFIAYFPAMLCIDTIPFFECLNAAYQTLELAVYYISDSKTLMLKWCLPLIANPIHL